MSGNVKVTQKMLESAARNLCLIRKVDPNSEVEIDGVKMPAWTLMQEEILAHMQVTQAIGTGFNNLNPDGSPRGPRLIIPGR